MPAQQAINTDTIVYFSNGQQIDTAMSHKYSSVVIHPIAQNDIERAISCGFAAYVDGHMVKQFAQYKNLYRVMLDVDFYCNQQIDVYMIIVDDEGIL